MSWRHPTTILREEFAAQGVLPAPRKGERTERPWQVHVHSEKRDGRWYSWPTLQASKDRFEMERALRVIVEKYDIEWIEHYSGDAILKWPARRDMS